MPCPKYILHFRNRTFKPKMGQNLCWPILRRFCIFVLFTFSALLLTSPLSCLARFIVLWDIRNLSIIDCEQNLTTIADSKLGSWENVDDDWGFIQIGSFYVKEPVLVIKWWGGERRGGVLRRWWRLEIALRWKLIWMLLSSLWILLSLLSLPLHWDYFFLSSLFCCCLFVGGQAGLGTLKICYQPCFQNTDRKDLGG